MTQMTLAQALAAQTEEFPSWENMSDVEQLHSIWWDAYKDAYGFRPRGQDVGHWTAEDFRSELDRLGEVIDRAEKERVEQEAEMAVRFEARVEETIKLGAADRETALRWIMDADDCQGDWEFLCYKNGLAYGYFKNV